MGSNMDTIKSIKFDASEVKSQIGTNCPICGKFFPVFDMNFERRLCDECRERLMKLLYPEDKS